MAQSGNGIDIGTVYQLLVAISARLDHMEARLDSHDRKLDQLLDIVNGHSRALADHTRQLDDLNAGVTELRSTVSGYHEAVVSQGIHYTELDGRVRRVERHLKLEPGGD